MLNPALTLLFNEADDLRAVWLMKWFEDPRTTVQSG